MIIGDDYEMWEIGDNTLEFIPSTHQYLVNGILVPSVTTIIKQKFPNKYKGISQEVLDKASERGTRIHEIIEMYYTANMDDPSCIELRNMKFLQKHFRFEVEKNEVPIIIFNDKGVPICAGRLDLVLKENGLLGLGDIKTTSTLDREYLAYQLNLYRIGYQQCYKEEIHFLKGVHLRESVRKYVDIPINENLVKELIGA